MDTGQGSESYKDTGQGPVRRMDTGQGVKEFMYSSIDTGQGVREQHGYWIQSRGSDSACSMETGQLAIYSYTW